jgi:hypothetical protein
MDATMLAREKQNQMKESFKRWIFENPDRRQKYVDYYNETFNNVRLRQYAGRHLQFPGMNPEITLKEHQKNAVVRILIGHNTLLSRRQRKNWHWYVRILLQGTGHWNHSRIFHWKSTESVMRNARRRELP